MQQISAEPLATIPTELLKQHPFALQCFNEVHRSNKGDEIFSEVYRTNKDLIPLASGSKAIMGFATMLFLYEKSDLLKNTQKAGETRSEEYFLPHDITIKQLLKNRETSLQKKISEVEEAGVKAILKQKLAGIKAYLEYAENNEVFANTTIKSLLNHTSKMGSVHFEDREIASDKDEHEIDPTKFVSFLKSHKECFNSDNSDTFKYNNKAYALLGSIMDLMTNEQDGFIREINKYAEKIGAKFSSYHKLGEDVLAGPNFCGTHTFEPNFEYFADRNIFSLEGLGCSYSSGGMCATSENAFKFLSAIADFYSGNKENPFMEFIPEKDGQKPNGTEIFNNFSTLKEAPKKDTDKKGHEIEVQKESSLGFYRETRTIEREEKPYITKLYRDGVLPLFELYFETKITKEKTEEKKDTTFDAYHEDPYCGFINFAKRVMLDRGDLFKLVGEISEDDIQKFKKDFKEKLIELKSESEEEKANIANGVCCILNLIIEENPAKKTIKLKEFSELSDEPILKIFADFGNIKLQNQPATEILR